MRELSEMTLEELWELFPIILSEHKSEWKQWYQEEMNRLRTFLPQSDIQIHHIGSTAIPDIMAKPIVDILVEIPKAMSMEEIKTLLLNNGYLCMSESEERKSFNRGYTKEGFAQKVFHLHLRIRGDHDEIYFRDYLKKHRDVAGQYEQLKLSLLEPFRHNRDGYTEAKSEFVKYYTSRAKTSE